MAQRSEYKGPLDGVNVIDFGHYYAGPMAAMLLADQGANVVRVVRPGGPELRKQQYRLLNRNKKLLSVDLKTDAGKAQALSLIESADVLIENFRPGVMKRLGLDYSHLKATNPGLIYLSLPGFASTDKTRAHIQAWEGVLSAAACLYTEMSGLRHQLNYPPLYTSIPHCSVYGALHGVIAVMAALLARENYGIGTVIETPLVEAAMSGFPTDFIATRLGSVYKTIPEAFEGLEFSSKDCPITRTKKMRKAWSVSQETIPPNTRFYECKDGRLFAFIGGIFPKWSTNFYQALGIEKQLIKEGFVNVGPWVRGLDNNLSDYGGLSSERSKRLEKILAEKFLTKTADEWETLLADKALLLTPRTRDEWLALEPMLKTAALVRMDNGETSLTVPGRAVDVSGPGGGLMVGFEEAKSVTEAEANRLFEDRNKDPLLHETACLLKKGDLLKGLKVLDMANILAGPTATYFLAQYGAEVIKVDPTETAPHLLKVILEANQGKRSLLAEFKTEPGQELLRRLVFQSDVVMHNILDNTAARLGVTHEQLQSINPNVVSCQLSCFGGSFRGGWENRLGIDTTAQAATGLLTHYGSVRQPQSHGSAAAGDITAGLGLAFSALLGVYQQRRTGYACEVRTSLVRMINYYQFPYMISENSTSDWGEARGQHALGETAWQRLYECSDGWIYVGTSEGQAPLLAENVTGQPDLDESLLEEKFVGKSCARWLKTLGAAGFGCHRVLSIKEFCEDTQLCPVDNAEADETVDSTLKVMLRKNHPCGTSVVLPLPTWVRVGEGHSYKRLATAPRYGQHTRDILRELGYGEDDIEKLIQLGIVYEFLPVLGSKDAWFFQPEKQ